MEESNEGKQLKILKTIKPERQEGEEFINYKIRQKIVNKMLKQYLKGQYGNTE